METRRPRQHRQSVESRARILDATSELVAEVGYDGASMSRVSHRAGLPTGSIHWHFGTKDQLVEAALRHSFEQWQSAGARQDEGQVDDVAEAIRAIIHPLASSVHRQPTFLQMGIRLALDQRPGTANARAIFQQYRLDGFHTSVRALTGLLPDSLAADRRSLLANSLTRLIMAATDGVILALEIGEAGIDIDAHFDHVRASVLAAVQAAHLASPSAGSRPDTTAVRSKPAPSDGPSSPVGAGQGWRERSGAD